MNSISLKAYAKINLGLDVLGTLPDGYHEVKMVMQSISLYDKVNIKKNDSGTINVKTNLSYLPVNGDNLVYKAAYIMKEKYNILHYGRNSACVRNRREAYETSGMSEVLFCNRKAVCECVYKICV